MRTPKSFAKHFIEQENVVLDFSQLENKLNELKKVSEEKGLKMVLGHEEGRMGVAHGYWNPRIRIDNPEIKKKGFYGHEQWIHVITFHNTRIDEFAKQNIKNPQEIGYEDYSFVKWAYTRSYYNEQWFEKENIFEPIDIVINLIKNS